VRSLDDVASVVAAYNGLELYGDDELETLRQEALQGYADLCTGCGYCKECPQDIPVSKLMETCNFALLGNPEAAFGRLKWHWGVENVDELIEKCIDCGRCEELCTQHLPIRERFAVIRDAWEKGRPKP
jgi:predicted aldo/keto reductase-like oxidoreductase